MYGYVPELTIESVLENYSQEDIFEMVFGEYPDLNNLYLSPFRDDHHPNCFFEWYRGRLMFRDYAGDRRDCIDAVKDKFKLANVQDALRFIIDHMEKNPPSVEKYMANKYEEHESESDELNITLRPREFQFKDELYWKQFHITDQQLKEDEVDPVLKFRFYSKKQKQWIVIRPFDITYAIRGFDTRCKIYRPLFTGKKGKWITNCKPDDIGNYKNLPDQCDTLIITKSYKDHRVIRNEGYNNTVWFQSEKMYPSPSLLKDLSHRANRILIFYDNDKTGIEGSDKLKNLIYPYNHHVITTISPFPLFKDPAAIVDIRGKNELKTILYDSIKRF